MKEIKNKNMSAVPLDDESLSLEETVEQLNSLNEDDPNLTEEDKLLLKEDPLRAQFQAMMLYVINKVATRAKLSGVALNQEHLYQITDTVSTLLHNNLFFGILHKLEVNNMEEIISKETLENMVEAFKFERPVQQAPKIIT
jgi:hypothetical protein